MERPKSDIPWDKVVLPWDPKSPYYEEQRRLDMYNKLEDIIGEINAMIVSDDSTHIPYTMLQSLQNIRTQLERIYASRNRPSLVVNRREYRSEDIVSDVRMGMDVKND